MAQDKAPNSYKDPFWSDLAGRVEAKLDLPPGLLLGVVTRGERSNADQVSEAGARTPFQIIPQTRDAVVKKYGIDPYLSPENAAEAAGLLLKESLQRNGGDVAAAVGEYHGGTDRANWGTRTKAYIQRVAGGQEVQAQPRQSTFQRIKAQREQERASVSAGSIANVLAAYQSGQMSPEEAQQFKADVESGMVMLPRGATLDGARKPSANQIPDAVLKAYRSGQMSDEERAQFQDDVKSGLVALPPGEVLDQSTLIPGYDAALNQPKPEAPGPSVVDRVIGAGETGANLVTGAVGGGIGMTGGFIGGLAGSVMSGEFGTEEGARKVAEAAQRGAEALTYTPRTPEGQRQAAIVGEVMQQAIPVMPLTAEMAALARSAPAARMAAQDAARAAGDRAGAAAARGAESVQQGAQRVAQPVREFFGADPAREATATPGTGQSVGAAGTDVATLRRQAASDLPDPIELTQGQATRDFEQLRFEKEQAKNPDLGAPLREAADNQNAKVLSNFDHWIDQTGAEATSLRQAGEIVDKAVRDKAAREKAEIRARYKEAEKAGEMEAPVSLASVVKHVNDSMPEAETAPILKVARQKLVSIGAAEVGPDGLLIPLEVPLKTAELVRRAIGQSTDYAPTNMRQSAIMKGLIDEAKDGLGGDLYRQARALRTRFAQQYENRAVISDLLNNKRGMDDRKVAFEDVFRRTVLDGSLDDVRQVRRVLQTGGDQGKQAWRELQGQALQHIREEATKGVTTDSRGNPVVSAAGLNRIIGKLDKDGKLDFLFGKRGAQQLRDINDIVKYIYTAPPGTINTSNTASVLLAALTEAGVLGGMTGMPVPVATGLKVLSSQIRDRKLRARIAESLRQNRPGGAPLPKPGQAKRATQP